MYHKETLSGEGKEQNRLRMWILLGSIHNVRTRRVGEKPNLCLALLAFSWKLELSLRIKFSAKIQNLTKYALSYQLMLKYHVFQTP